MSEERLSEALTAMEAGLASLQPKPSSLHRARVLYLAGQASVREAKAVSRNTRVGWLWPVATAGSLLLAVTLAGVLLLGGARPPTVERVVEVPVDPPEDSTGERDHLLAVSGESLGPPLRIDYLVLRRLVLTQGLDALPVAQAPASPEGETVTPLDAYGESIDLDRSG
ncbi:hypothetical protein ACFL5Q_01485 [Planctomycetota bacterium]